MILFGENGLRNAVREYVAHYHAERNHQGLANQVIEPSEYTGKIDREIQTRERLGGMLKYYHSVGERIGVTQFARICIDLQ